ncbi:hypothetical protein VZT92_022552 [Zoarces viviparus]|uniref:Uncharacterized protein n=1 Tax=Zoarces viviparus TaxID=48416 RepID=A0AAW1EE04_ZOAVI
MVCRAPPARRRHPPPSPPQLSSLHSHPCCSDELIDTIFHLPGLSESEREKPHSEACSSEQQQHCGHF